MMARRWLVQAWLAFAAVAIAVPATCVVGLSPSDREWPLPEAVARLEKAGFRCVVLERDHVGGDDRYHHAGLYVCGGDARPDWDAASSVPRPLVAGPVVVLNVIYTPDGPVVRLDGLGRIEVWGDEQVATAVRNALR
jgi:hypothetical protein